MRRKAVTNDEFAAPEQRQRQARVYGDKRSVTSGLPEAKYGDAIGPARRLGGGSKAANSPLLPAAANTRRASAGSDFEPVFSMIEAR